MTDNPAPDTVLLGKNTLRSMPEGHEGHARRDDVHRTAGTRRVFRQFSCLEVGSVKMALSRPTPPDRRP